MKPIKPEVWYSSTRAVPYKESNKQNLYYHQIARDQLYSPINNQLRPIIDIVNEEIASGRGFYQLIGRDPRWPADRVRFSSGRALDQSAGE